MSRKKKLVERFQPKNINDIEGIQNLYSEKLSAPGYNGVQYFLLANNLAGCVFYKDDKSDRKYHFIVTYNVKNGPGITLENLKESVFSFYDENLDDENIGTDENFNIDEPWIGLDMVQYNESPEILHFKAQGDLEDVFSLMKYIEKGLNKCLLEYNNNEDSLNQ